MGYRGGARVPVRPACWREEHPLTGLSLLLLCVGKILVLDVWRQNRSDRYVAFTILGVASLLVSFLYTRYSEAIRRYL